MKGDKIRTKCGELIDLLGPRLAGSEAALKCADLLRDEANIFADTSNTEDFDVHPRAFLAFIRVSVWCYLLALATYWFAPWISFIFQLFAVVVIVGEFILYKKILDPFFKLKTGRNVVASVEPQSEVRRQIIVCGHHDSAQLFNFYIDKPEKYAQRVFSGVGMILMLFIVSGVTAVIQPAEWLQTALLVFFILGAIPVVALWNFASDEGSPGAGDNLVASLIALEIARHFAQNPLKHTRVLFVSFDAEESGLKGARAYAEAHKNEFKELPTYCFNMDCIYNKDELLLLTSDLNNTVPLSKEMTQCVAQVIREKGEKVSVQPIAFFTGGTDAAELAKVGVMASSLMAMKWDNSVRSNAYHTPLDTIEVINEDAVDFVYEVGLEVVRRIDTTLP